MPRTFRYSRPRLSSEETLLDFLSTKFSYLTITQWKEHLHAGHLSIGGVQVSDGNSILRQNDIITFAPPRTLEPPVDDARIEILYEDAKVVVCVKNGNLPVSEGGCYCENTLISILRRRGTRPFYTNKTLEGVGNESIRVRSAVSPKRPREDTEAKESPFDFYPIHRLDKETSGVLVIAKSSKVAKHIGGRFQQQSTATIDAIENVICAVSPSFAVLPRLLGSSSNPLDAVISPAMFARLHEEAKAVRKSYVAILSGAAAKGMEVVVNARIASIRSLPPSDDFAQKHGKLTKLKMVCVEDVLREAINRERAFTKTSTTDVPETKSLGKVAISRVRVVASSARWGISLAKIDLLTGRTHQIRLHCAHLGYPVLGDKLYTTRQPGEVGFSFPVEDNVYFARVRDTEERFPADSITPAWRCARHLLHAARLSFPYHATGEEEEREMSFGVPSLRWFEGDVRHAEEGAMEELRRMLREIE
ncbi:unnamed protein product [Phytomonas sp. EM1]|nr:unnamed protein product [Phytomonas sp. EM1]|eukprot:CCW61626.1 unnamed protein product [Phytomonas sp. isolate EM1]